MPQLEHCDEQLIAAARSNRTLDFSSSQPENQATHPGKPMLNIALFRSVLSGSYSPGAVIRDAASMSWIIKGASFLGTVDLSDSSGGTLPAIEFEDCDFPQGFTADNSSFIRLTFRGCNFGVFWSSDQLLLSISLRNAAIRGDLTLSRLESLHEDKLLIIHAPNIRIESGFCLSESSLIAPKDTRTGVEQRSNYALNLARAEIRCDLSLFPRLSALGGVRLRECQVGGDLSLLDLSVDDGYTSAERLSRVVYLQKYALDATGISIRGNLYFSPMTDLPKFRANGPVNFYGMTIEGSVQLGDASFSSLEGDPALSLAGARIKGSLRADTAKRESGEAGRLSVSGTLSLHGAQIDGFVLLQGDVGALEANLLRVTSDVVLALRVESSVNLGGSTIQGMLDLSSFSFPDRAWSARKTAYSFWLRDADIGHTLYLVDPATTADPVFKACERSMVSCYPDHAVFAIDVEAGTASILWKAGAMPHVLDGTSGHFHLLNQAGAINLRTQEAIRDYIKLFGAYVWAEEGPFVVIDDVQQLPSDTVTDLVAERIRKGIVIDKIQASDLDSVKPLVVEAWDQIPPLEKASIDELQFENVWSSYKEQFQRHAVRAHAVVRHSKNVFSATFVVLTKSFNPVVSKEVLQRPKMNRLSRQIAAHFRARMSPFQAGYIGMVDDEDLLTLPEKSIPLYERPLIRPAPSSPSFFFKPRYTSPSRDYSAASRESFSQIELSLRIPDWPVLLKSRLARFQDAQLNLTNATCKTLDDADGRAWGSDVSALFVDNFTYSNIAPSSSNVISRSGLGNLLLALYRDRSRVHGIFLHPFVSRYLFRSVKQESSLYRLRWLRRIPNGIFIPQPYAQLATVLGKAGHIDGAKAVEQEKTDLEVKEHFDVMRARGTLYSPFAYPYLIVWRLFRLCFGYGLSPRRASATVMFCLLLGWFGTASYNHAGYLVQSTSTSATLVAKDSTGVLIFAYPRATSNYDTSDVPCGSSINEFLYSSDVFIPLLDLRQETRCDIRSPHQGEIYPVFPYIAKPRSSNELRRFVYAILHSGVFWAQIGKSLYAILGWIVVSGAILTYSGYLRRKND